MGWESRSSTQIWFRSSEVERQVEALRVIGSIPIEATKEIRNERIIEDMVFLFVLLILLLALGLGFGVNLWFLLLLALLLAVLFVI